MSNLRSFNDLRMGQPNALVGTRSLVEIESENLTLLQNLSIRIGEGSYTKFGTLQVTQDGNGMVILLLDLADDIK